MSRLQGAFAELRVARRAALIPFITAGDPHPDFTVPALHALVEAGADVLEIGVPFSDPMADGPVIQRASERALSHRASLRKTLAMVAAFRRNDTVTPVVLMGYLNPIEAMGYAEFAEAARASGVDGVLTVDLPPEESDELLARLAAVDIDPIFLLAPTSTEARIRRMGELGRGYLYYVSLKGVTGAANLDVDEVRQRLTLIRGLTDLPVGVGFGVKDAAIAAALARFADAVVVGSALVGRIEAAGADSDRALREIVDLIADMRRAMDAPVPPAA